MQGDQAAPAIAKAIQTANTRNECDVLIVARGGGSLEDLWPFNEEVTAKAIYESTLPIISGVGHEIDFTIADFVADVRAPTPSAAAEIATPDRKDILQKLARNRGQLERQIRHTITQEMKQLSWISKHLLQLHPRSKLTEKMQKLDFCEARLSALLSQKIQILQTALARAASKLDGISPLATLARGYAIATEGNGRILQSTQQVKPGDNIFVKIQDGSLSCEVTGCTESRGQAAG